jgi:hypothetical protein
MTRRAAMYTTVLALAAAAGFALVGCKARTQTVGAAPATPERLAEIRAGYAAERPGTIVGPITAVLPEQSLAAIGDIPPDRFAEGDLVSILDGKEQTIAVARVVRRLDDSVHVRYQSNPNARAPVEGDVAVRLPSGR